MNLIFIYLIFIFNYLFLSVLSGISFSAVLWLLWRYQWGIQTWSKHSFSWCLVFVQVSQFHCLLCYGCYGAINDNVNLIFIYLIFIFNYLLLSVLSGISFLAVLWLLWRYKWGIQTCRNHSFSCCPENWNDRNKVISSFFMLLNPWKRINRDQNPCHNLCKKIGLTEKSHFKFFSEAFESMKTHQ